MISKIEISVPHSWADLSEKQLLIISEMLLSTGKSEEYIQIWALKFFSGLKILQPAAPGVFLCKFKGKKILLESWQINIHRKKLSWITGVPRGVKPLHELQGYRPVFDTLEGTPLKLYLAAENYYQAYLYTEDEFYLRCLASVLYSAGTSWNDSDTAELQNYFKGCSPAELFTVFLWYNSIKQILADQFPYLFAPSENTGNNTPDMRSHINNMLRVLTSCDVTKMEAVLDSETWYALFELNEKAREVEEFNAKQRNG